MAHGSYSDVAIVNCKSTCKEAILLPSTLLPLLPVTVAGAFDPMRWVLHKGSSNDLYGLFAKIGITNFITLIRSYLNCCIYCDNNSYHNSCFV